jgi:phosphopantetheinyl transferase
VCAKPVGVDIELRRAIPDFEALAGQVFSALEMELWKSERNIDRFLSVWTRKEALLKGIGLGVATYVRDVSVFFDNTEEVTVPRALSPENWVVQTRCAEDEIWSVAVPFDAPETVDYCFPVESISARRK